MQLRIDPPENHAQGITMVRVDGGLDNETTDEFSAELVDLVESGHRKIIIDAGQLTFLSSVGIGALLTLHKRMAKRGGEVKIAALQGLVFDALRLSGLTRLLAIHPDVAQAELAFRDPE